MKFPSFKIEDYFTKYEFSTQYMMGSSDPETHRVSELIAMADMESLALWDNLSLGYTEYYGLPLLREEISKLYPSLTAENILVCAGAEETIFVSLHVLLEKGDEVVIVTPCYQSLLEIPKILGAQVTEMPLTWQDNHWSFDLEQFSNRVTNRTKLVILNFPHNPTGFQPSQALFKEIIDIIRNRGSYLLCDEVYRLSEYNLEDRLPNAADCYEKAMSIGVMSKSFGLPGLRIGWLALSDKSLLGEFASNKNYTSMCNSAPSEILSLIALRNKETILGRNVRIAQQNLDFLDQFFHRHSSLFDWYRPTVGFLSFPKLKLPVSIDDFAKKFVDEHDVLILPGTVFDNTKNHFRIGYGKCNLPEALNRFEQYMLSY